MPKYYGYEIPRGLDFAHMPGWTDGRIIELLHDWALGLETVVEIGSYKGKSAAALADACSGTVYCIDEWLDDWGDERRPEREMPIEIYKQFLAHMAHLGFLEGKVVPIACSSAIAWKMFTEIPIDMLYVDGLHTFDGVMSDLNNWYDLVRESGIICGDDYRSPSVGRAVRTFAEHRGIKFTLYVDDKLWRLEH